MKYQAEINDAYQEIKKAGVSVIVAKPLTGTFDPVTETIVYPSAFLTQDMAAEDLLLYSNPVFNAPGIAQIDSERIFFEKNTNDCLTGLMRNFDDTIASEHVIDSDIFHVCEAAFTYVIVKNYSESLIGTGMIQIGDCQIVIPAKNLSFEIDNTCEIHFLDSQKYSVINPNSKRPDNQPIVYNTQARKM